MVGTRYGAEDYLEGCFNSLRDEKGLWNDSEDRDGENHREVRDASVV